MIWPFRKREPKAPTLTWEEFIQTLPEPPCHDRKDHYHWEIAANLPCPVCAANEKHRQDMEDEDRFARKIAERIAEVIHEKQSH